MNSRSQLLISMIFIAYCSRAVQATDPLDTSASQGRGTTLLDNGLTRTLRHIYTQCSSSDRDIFWCFKVQGAKLLGRALKVQNINIVEGLSLVKKLDNETRSARASANELHLGNKDLERLSSKSLDTLLYDRFDRFIESRQLQVILPRLLMFGQRNSETLGQQLLSLFSSITGSASTEDASAESEGRKKKGDDKKYLGPFIAAVLLKAAIMKMAYHSIAIVAGKALIVGKIALIISAIIGLKKLVSGEGGEKTTYEIVKHPQVQQSHTYSSSHSGEYEGGHESGGGGSYHRSMDDEMMMQDKAYRAWVPTKAA